MATNPYEGKSIPELLTLLETQAVGTERHEQLKMVLLRHNTELIAGSLDGLRVSFENTAASNDRLAGKVFWLNVILTAATVLASLVALFEVCHKVLQ